MHLTEQISPDTTVDADLEPRLLMRARIAVLHMDLKECCRIADWAVKTPLAAAAPALGALLEQPGGIRHLKKWQSKPWIEMRCTAIDALRITPSPLAASFLARSLIADVPEVREHANKALLEIGSNAVEALNERVWEDRTWSLDGMLATVDTLGQLGDKSTGPTVTRVLFGILPNVPRRFIEWQMRWAALAGLCLTVFTFVQNPGDGARPIDILWFFQVCTWFGICTTVSAILLLGPVQVKKRREADTLSRAAAHALISINDVRSIPSLIEVATEEYPQAARNGACLALRSILPSLGPSDYGLLNGACERNLTGMFATHDASTILCIIKALEFIGSGQSAGPVERLIRRKPTSHDAGLFAEARIEAERVLPILQERKRQEEAASVLLRPSQVTADTAAVLLRPATNLATYEEGEQLLRPGQNGQ